MFKITIIICTPKHIKQTSNKIEGWIHYIILFSSCSKSIHIKNFLNEEKISEKPLLPREGTSQTDSFTKVLHRENLTVTCFIFNTVFHRVGERRNQGKERNALI